MNWHAPGAAEREARRSDLRSSALGVPGCQGAGSGTMRCRQKVDGAKTREALALCCPVERFHRLSVVREDATGSGDPDAISLDEGTVDVGVGEREAEGSANHCQSGGSRHSQTR